MNLFNIQEEQQSLVSTPEDYGSPVSQDPESVKKYKATMATISQTGASDDVLDMSEKYTTNLQRIESGEEEGIRQELAQEQYQSTVNTTKQLMEEAAIEENWIDFDNLFPEYKRLTGDPAAYTEYTKKHALEAATTEKLLVNASTNPVQEKIVSEGFGGIEDRLTKIQIFAQMAEKYQKKWDDEQSLVGVVTDYLGFAYPLAGVRESSGNVAIGDEGSNTFFKSGTRFQQEAFALFDVRESVPEFELKAEQFFKSLEDTSGTVAFNPTMAKQWVGQVLGAADPETDDFLGGADTVLSATGVAKPILGVGKAAKAGMNIARLSKLAGDAKTSSEIIASKLSKDGGEVQDTILSTIKDEDAIRDSMPSAFSPSHELVGANAPEAVKQQLELSDKIKKRLTNMQVAKTLNLDEVDEGIKATTKELNKQLGRLKIADVQAIDNPLSTSTSVKVRIGKQDGLGWVSKKNATTWIERNGFDSAEMKPVRAADGRYYLEVNRTVDETKALDEMDLDLLTTNPINQVTQRGVFNASGHLPREIDDYATTATITRDWLNKNIYRPLEKGMVLPTTEQKKIFDKVVQEGRDSNKYFNQTELKASWRKHAGRGITDKEMAAYYAGKEISDINHYLLNKAAREAKTRKGFKEVTINTPQTGFSLDRAVGKVIDRVIEPSERIRVLNASEGKLYKRGEFTPEISQSYRDRNFFLVKLEEQTIYNGNPVDYVLVNKHEMKIKELNSIILPYKAGTIGSRQYQGKWWIKQARIKKFTDGDGEYVSNPIAHAVAMTKTDAIKYQTKWEKARQALLDYESGKITKAEADDIVGETGEIETIEELSQIVENGKMEKDQPFQVLFDREQVQIGNPAAYKFADELDPTYEYLTSYGRPIYSRRGDERVVDVLGGDAPVLNVYDTMSDGVQNAMRSTAFDGFIDTQVEKWYKTANAVGALKPNMSAAQAWADPNPFINTVDSTIKRQLELLRKPIQRIVNTKTPTARYWEEVTRSIGEWIETGGETALGKARAKLGQKLAPVIYDLQSKSPIAAMRGFAFHTKLGLFNAGQMLVQSAQLYNAMLISPVQGVKAMTAAPWIRLAIANGNDSVIDYVAKLKAHGMKPEEFKLYVKELQNSGWMDVGGSVMHLDKYSDTYALNRLGLGFKKVLDKGTMFFNEAEKWNRIAAHGIAWREFKGKFPDAEITSDVARKWINGRTNTLSAQMLSNSAAAWNKGPLSALPTQFLSYHERIVNQMLPVMFGGSNKISKGAKFRLALGQLLLYGTAGLPAGEWAYEQIQKATGTKPTEEQHKLLTQGFFDAVLRHYLDADVDYSNRVAIGAGLENLVRDLSDKGLVDVLVGPSGNIIGSQLDSLRRAATVLTAGYRTTNSAELGLDVAIEATRTISSLNNAVKAYWMYNYQLNKTNTGKILDAQDYSEMEILMQALSVTPYEVTQARDLYLRNQEIIKDGDFKNLQGLVKNLQLEAMIRPEKAEKNANIIHSIIQNLESDPYKQDRLVRSLNNANLAKPEFMEQIKENLRLEGPTLLNKEGLTQEEQQ